jgi:hypothetical protein
MTATAAGLPPSTPRTGGRRAPRKSGRLGTSSGPVTGKRPHGPHQPVLPGARSRLAAWAGARAPPRLRRTGDSPVTKRSTRRTRPPTKEPLPSHRWDHEHDESCRDGLEERSGFDPGGDPGSMERPSGHRGRPWRPGRRLATARSADRRTGRQVPGTRPRHRSGATACSAAGSGPSNGALTVLDADAVIALLRGRPRR